jgi:hypothetical protein
MIRVNPYWADFFRARFSSWPRVNALRLVGDTIKHADGFSCEEMKAMRADLFSRPESRDYVWSLGPEFQPLAGDSLYITLDQFTQYSLAVKELGSELANSIEHKRRYKQFG